MTASGGIHAWYGVAGGHWDQESAEGKHAGAVQGRKAGGALLPLSLAECMR